MALTSFPMRIDWEKTLPPAERVPFPDPIVSSRDGLIPYVIKPIADLQKYAERRGWVTLVQYAHGYVPLGAAGKPSEQSRESFALRMRRDHGWAVALYTAGATTNSAWSWDMLYTWGANRRPLKYENVTAFKAVL